MKTQTSRTGTSPNLERVQKYLTDLDNCLLSRGVNPRQKLDYIEEAADVLLTTDIDPTEEFGTPAEYADRLAKAIGVRPYRSSLRNLTLFVGMTLFLVSIMGLNFGRNAIPENRVFPILLPKPQI